MIIGGNFNAEDAKDNAEDAEEEPLRSSAKSSAPFAFRSQRSLLLKMVATQIGLGSLTRSGEHVDFRSLQGCNDFDFCLLAINHDAAIRVRGKAFDGGDQAFNRRGCQALQATGFTALA